MTNKMSRGVSMQILINHSAFNDQAKELVILGINTIIEQLPELNLVSLDSIIVPHDYGIELAAFQENITATIGYTNSGLGIGVGKTLAYLENDMFKTTIFLDPRLVAGIIDDSGRQSHTHIIHHELCHVHDDNEKYRVFGVCDIDDLFIHTDDMVKQLMYTHADNLWSEYIATKLSAGSRPDDHHFYVKSLFAALSVTLPEIQDEITKFKTHSDIRELFGHLQLKISYLLKITGYFLGYCNAIVGSIPPEFSEEIQSNYPYFEVPIVQLQTHLKLMEETYGSWVDSSIFERLAEGVLLLWENLGIRLYNNEGQLYVDV